MIDMNRFIKRANALNTVARVARKTPTSAPVTKVPIKDIPLSGPSPVRSAPHRQHFYTEEQARRADELGHTRLPTRAEYEAINGPYREPSSSPSVNDYASEYAEAMKEYRRQRLMGINPVMEEIDLSPQARTPKPLRSAESDYASEYAEALKEYRRQRLMGINPTMEEIDLSPQARTPKPPHRQHFYTDEQARMADELGYTRLPTRAEYEAINGPYRGPSSSPVNKVSIKDIPLSGPSPVRSGPHRQPFYTEEQARIADQLGYTRFPTKAEFEGINGPLSPIRKKPRFNFNGPNIDLSKLRTLTNNNPLVSKGLRNQQAIISSLLAGSLLAPASQPLDRNSYRE